MGKKSQTKLPRNLRYSQITTFGIATKLND